MEGSPEVFVEWGRESGIKNTSSAFKLCSSVISWEDKEDVPFHGVPPVVL